MWENTEVLILPLRHDMDGSGGWLPESRVITPVSTRQLVEEEVEPLTRGTATGGSRGSDSTDGPRGRDWVGDGEGEICLQCSTPEPHRGIGDSAAIRQDNTDEVALR